MIKMIVIAAMLGVLGPGAAPASAASTSESVSAVWELSSQARPRARLRVHPGRLLYRDCTFRLVQQVRPDGIFIVPRQRCWWVRG